jgi:hypothetical protein
MRKPWEIWDIIAKLASTRNTLDDAIQLMNQLAEQQQNPQKQLAEDEAPQPPIGAMPSSDSGALLDMKSAAKYLGMSPNFVRRIYRENIPYIILGTGMKKLRIRFRRCDLDVWILKHRVGQK